MDKKIKKKSNYKDFLNKEIKRKKEILLDVLQKDKYYQQICEFRVEKLKIPKSGYGRLNFSKDLKLAEINKELFAPIEYLQIPFDDYKRGILIERWPEILLLADDICSQARIDKSYQYAIFDYVLFDNISDSSLQSDILFEVIPQDEMWNGDFSYDQSYDNKLFENDKKYPFKLHFGTLAGQGDLLNFIKNHWDKIERQQLERLGGDKPNIREKPKRDVRSLIWKNRNREPEIIQDIIKKYCTTSEVFYSSDEIRLIILQETRRRQM